MSVPEKVEFELKKELLDHNLQPMRDISMLKKAEIEKIIDECGELPEKIINEEMYNISPILLMGETLKNLIKNLPAKDHSEAADFYTWIVKIKNEIIKKDGKLELSKDDITKLLQMLDKTKPEQLSPLVNGQVYNYLKTLEGKFYPGTVQTQQA